MKLLKLFLAACIIFGITGVGLAAETYNSGKIWMNLSKEAKLYWVWGFANGQEVLLEEAKTKKAMKYDITDLEAPVICEVMTEYYKDPGNSYIPWKYMTYIAKMKLKGKSIADIETELSLLREYSDYERKKLQMTK